MQPKSCDFDSQDFNVGFLGDTYFCELYAERSRVADRFHPLNVHDYDGWLESFQPFLHANQLNIANLETPLTELTQTPYWEDRPWPHRAEPTATLDVLERANIGAVTLGNNHLYDYALQGMLDTFDHIDSRQLTNIGAGRTAFEAVRPLVIRARMAKHAETGEIANSTEDGFDVVVLAGFSWRSSVARRFQGYAHDEEPGCNPINDQFFAAIRFARHRYPNALIVVIPHWQADYKWATRAQRRFAVRAAVAGADLTIGHGSHMLQQIERIDGKLAVHSLGNFIFNSPGRFAKHHAPPLGAAARLCIEGGDITAARLKLYPILTDNRTTTCWPAPLRRVHVD